MALLKRFFRFNWLSKSFFIRIFLVLIAVVVVQKIIGVAYISDTFALGAMGFIAGLIGLGNWEKRIGTRNIVDKYNTIKGGDNEQSNG